MNVTVNQNAENLHKALLANQVTRTFSISKMVGYARDNNIAMSFEDIANACDSRPDLFMKLDTGAKYSVIAFCD